MAAVFDVEIDQGATWTRRMYVVNKRIVTANVTTDTLIIGQTSIPIIAGGIGAIVAGDQVVFSAHTDGKSYIVQTGIADLSVGGTMVLASPIEQITAGGTLDVYAPVDLTGATFESQIRATADASTVTATLTTTLAADPTDAYFDLLISSTNTGAIPTTDKKAYDKKAKFTFDGKLNLGGSTIRTFNGTVLVSPSTTRAVV